MKSVSIRAALVIAAVYGYFLIFAQFAWVEILRAAGGRETPMLGAMAIAGIAAGFWVAWKGATAAKIRTGLVLAAVAAALAPVAGGFFPLLGISIFTGVAIGISTVGLATLLRSWGGLLWVGLGTGIGYASCNLPFVFLQSPEHQAWIASGFALIGVLGVPTERTLEMAESSRREFPFWAVLVLFTALVWLDSAAFFIIQHANDLRSGTWGDGLLWRNAVLHFLAAVGAGFWLKHGKARALPLVAWVILAAAALAVNFGSLRPMAGWLYPVAVSLYSVALVCWAGWFSGARNQHAVGWRAAWIFAVAGWFGSANGIGMAESLLRVPLAFIVISGGCVFAVMMISNRRHWRIAAAVLMVWIVAFSFGSEPGNFKAAAAERGKQVYLSEGCIHCHSQYVRPGTLDEKNWGPVRDDVLRSRPVLIGNRRQGPDLANVGARRSAAWLKQHFINPRLFSPASPMPSYAYLFDDSRGDDLVAYLQDAGVGEMSAVIEKAAVWKSSTEIPTRDGAALFASQCAVCHGNEGRGDGVMAAKLIRPPANLLDGPFIWSAAGSEQIRRIIKFGIPGTDMPGHEALQDSQIVALQRYVSDLRRSAAGME